MSRISRLFMLTCATACASGPTPATTPEQVIQTLPPPSTRPRISSQPDSDPRGAAVRALSQSRLSLNVQDAELSGLLLGFGRGVPLNIVIGPRVTGPVTADLENVSLLEVLEQIVRPRGFHYRIEGRTLRIFSLDRETRIYRLSYPNTVRTGLGEFTVSGALAQEVDISGASGGRGDSEDASTSSLTTRQELDLWGEVESAVQLLVFGSDGEETTTGNREERGPDGLPTRRVLISRQAGFVMVTAPRVVLEEVSAIWSW